jgi:hypothetical protein
MTCKQIARGTITAKDVSDTLKDELEGQESYTKIYLLTLHNTKLGEGYIEVHGYVKSVEEHSETLILNFLRSSSSSWPLLVFPMSRDPKENSRISKRPFHEDHQERHESPEQVQQPRGRIEVNLTWEVLEQT